MTSGEQICLTGGFVSCDEESRNYAWQKASYSATTRSGKGGGATQDRAGIVMTSSGLPVGAQQSVSGPGPRSGLAGVGGAGEVRQAETGRGHETSSDPDALPKGAQVPVPATASLATLRQLRDARPDLVAHFREEGRAEAAQAERERYREYLEIRALGIEDLREKMYREGVPAAEARDRISHLLQERQRDQGAAYLKGRKDQERSTRQPGPSAPPSTNDRNSKVRRILSAGEPRNRPRL
jgi:hypothetical protein